MKNNPFVGKSTRTKIFTVISVVAILLIFALNIWLASLGIFGNAYIDLTPEGLYTLTPEMERECDALLDNIDGEIEVVFCNDRDYLIDDFSTRVVYYMTLAMSKRYDNFNIRTVNVNINPTAVAEYKTTSLTQITSRDVIISYKPHESGGASARGARYRIASIDTFWRVLSDNTVYSYDGEYQLMSYMLSLTLINRPAAYFVTNHGEKYYDVNNPDHTDNAETGAFVDLLRDRGFEIKNISLADIAKEAKEKNVAPEIPEDCILLIINNPERDFEYDSTQASSLSYVSETEMLDRYMTDERGSIMVSLDYTKKLERLEDFLAEWGIESTGYKVTDKENSIKVDSEDDGSAFIADYNLDSESYAYQIYGDFSLMSSSPRFIVNNAGSLKTAFGLGQDNNEPGSSKTMRIFTPFLYSSSAASAKDENGNLAAAGKQVIAALGSRQTTESTSGDQTYSYVFCAASPVFFSNDYLSNTSYANFEIVSALVQNICRLDSFADSSLGGTSLNGDRFLGKELVDTSIRDMDFAEDVYDDNGELDKEISYGLTAKRRNVILAVIFIIPTVIAAVGIFVCVRRKYL